jgi:hypothetical protein
MLTFQTITHPAYSLPSHRGVCLQSQAATTVYIQNHKHSEYSSILKLITQEIHRPQLVETTRLIILLRKHDFTAADPTFDHIAVDELAFENFQAQRIEEMMLDCALQRTRTVNRIVTLVTDKLFGLFC